MWVSIFYDAKSNANFAYLFLLFLNSNKMKLRQSQLLEQVFLFLQYLYYEEPDLLTRRKRGKPHRSEQFRHICVSVTECISALGTNVLLA